MKIKAIIITLAALCGSANATLIDHGGWIGEPPSIFWQFVSDVPRVAAQFDQKLSDGWVGNGLLAGGTLFTTDFAGTMTTAHVSWDFGNSGFTLRWIYVLAELQNGERWAHLYQAPWQSRLEGEGTVTLNGVVNIYDIAFYGRIPTWGVPDGGSTLLLLLMGTLLLGVVRFQLC